jgi:hypothetical protein
VTTDAGANLLSNGDFELGCADWTAGNAVLSTDETAHSGDASCRVCGTMDASTNLHQLALVSAPVGARFVGEAWFRAAPDAAAPTAMDAYVMVVEGLRDDTGPFTGPSVPTATWTKIAAEVTVSLDAGTGVVLHVITPGPGCYLIDDAVLRRTN